MVQTKPGTEGPQEWSVAWPKFRAQMALLGLSFPSLGPRSGTLVLYWASGVCPTAQSRDSEDQATWPAQAHDHLPSHRDWKKATDVTFFSPGAGTLGPKRKQAGLHTLCGP